MNMQQSKEEVSYRLTFRLQGNKKEFIKSPLEDKDDENDTQLFIEDYLLEHLDKCTQSYQNRSFHGDNDLKQDCSIDSTLLRDPLLGAYFVGFQSSMNEKVMEYLVCLKQGLEYSKDVQRRIVYEKVNCMLILLSHDKRSRRSRLSSKDHGPSCSCDSNENGCRKSRLLEESMERLQKLDLQLETQKKSVKDNVDSQLLRFQHNKERYSPWSTLISNQRQRASVKRKANLLNSLRSYESASQVRVSQSINTYRKKAHEIENAEEERKRIFQERVGKRKIKMLSKKKKKKTNTTKQKINGGCISGEDIDGGENDGEKAGQNHEVYPYYSNCPPNETQHTDKGSQEFPVIAIQNCGLTNTNIALENMQTDSFEQGSLTLPKVENATSHLEPLNVQNTKNRQRKNDNLPQIKNDILQIDGENEIDSAINTTFQTRKVLARKKVQKKKTEEGKDEDDYYLQVDLRGKRKVDQIVLEASDQKRNARDQKIKKKKELLRKSKIKSFTLSYSNAVENWLNYNDADGNSLEEPKHRLDKSKILCQNQQEDFKNKSLFSLTNVIEEGDDKEEAKQEKQENKKEEEKETEEETNGDVVELEDQSVFEMKQLSDDDDDFTKRLEDDLIDSNRTWNDYDDKSSREGSIQHINLHRHTSPMFSLDDIKDRTTRKKKVREFEQRRQRTEEIKQRLKREKLLDDRRINIKLKMKKMKRDTQKVTSSRKTLHSEDSVEHSVEHCGEVDILSKYCIFTEEQLQWYQAVFDDFQEHELTSKNSGFLPLKMAIDALYIINKSLNNNIPLDYILQVLETFDVPVTETMDFKAFSLIAAFSEKLRTLKNHFNILGKKINYTMLIPCLSKSKNMYEMLLRENEKFIEVDDLLIEIRAANIDENILKYVLKNEGRSKLDFFDYLTFFPLFLHSHKVIIEDLTRPKK